MDNMMGQSSAFINPWGSQQTYVTSTSPYDLGIGENLKNVLPYRRHSLAQEQPVTRNNGNERLGSYSSRASFTSNSTDLFGSIWNNPNNGTMNDHSNHLQQQQLLLQQPSYLGGGPSSSSSSSSPFYSSPHFPSSSTSNSSSSALSPSLTRSFPPTQDGSHRPFRRFSLTPIIHETNLDQTNTLSSVPEESFQAYRRHSLAGPLVSSSSSVSSILPHPTTPSSLLSPDSQLHMSNYQYPLPNHHTGYSGSNNIARHTLANNNSAMTNHSPASFLASMEEEECSLLPFKLFESVDGQNQQQQQQQHPSFDQPLSWCMVEFKAGRAEIYYSTIPIQQDDWVIVEADRGRDLGKVVAKDLPLDQVHLLLAATNNSANSTPTTATTVLTAGADSLNNNSSTSNNNMLLLDHPPSPSASLSSTSSSSSSSSLPLPKQICRLATPSEITLLVTKRHDEQKALLICQTKSKQKNLLMDIVDAEYQWDRRKLTFYFIAERRVDFRELVRDLFKLYKTRIWMCSVNSVPKKNTASVKK